MKKLNNAVPNSSCTELSPCKTIVTLNTIQIIGENYIEKPMPTLADLERMFEDSDDDITSNENNLQETAAPTEQKQLTLIIDLDNPSSPNNHNKLSDQEQLVSDPAPTSKHCNDAHSVECDSDFVDLPAVVISPSSFATKTTYRNSDILEPIPKKLKIDNTNYNVPAIAIDEGNVSDNSLASNTKIETKLNLDTFPTDSLSVSFNPKPSSSKDNKTLIENDELFNKSLKLGSKLNKTPQRQVDDDLEIIEIPTETIVLEPDIKTGVDNNIRIHDLTKSSYDINIKCNGYIEDDDDDDCILIETQPETVRQEQNSNDIIDLDYSFLTPFPNTSDTSTITSDSIDVDALIAENQTIINKLNYSQIQQASSSLVVDVDVSAIVEKPTAVESNSDVDVRTALGLPTPNITVTEARNIPNAQVNESEVIEGPAMTLGAVKCNLINTIQREIRRVAQLQWGQQNIYSKIANYVGSRLNQYSSSHNLPNNLNTQFNHEPSQLNFYDSTREVQNTTTTNRTSRRKSTPKRKNTVPVTVTQQSHSTEELSSQQLSPTLHRSNTPSLTLNGCPICFETLAGRDIASTICGHVFCMKCLQQAFKSNKRCPVCRKILKKNGYHKIYL